MANTTIQNFNTDDCLKLVPQGTVLQEQRYVRVTLLGSTLDDLVITWDREDGSIFRPNEKFAVYGVPLWDMTRETVDIVQPKEVKYFKEHKALVSAEMILYPGLSNPPAPNPRPVIITEAEIAAGKIPDKRLDTWSPELGASLLRSGSLDVRTRVGEIIRIELKTSNPQVGKEDFLPKKSSDHLLSSNLGEPAALNLFKMQVFQNFGGDFVRAIEAYLADPRAGVWHDPSLPVVDGVKNIDNTFFHAIFSVIQTLPQWKSVTTHATTPRLPSFPIALVSVFKQQYTLNGYFRGRLIESVTIGPDESVTTEVFSFDRSTQERTDEYSSEVETTLQRENKQSITAEIMNEVQNSVGAGVGGQLGLGLPIDMVEVNGGISGDVKTELVTRNQTTANAITEAATNATERFKATHQVKTITRRETGTEQRTTRVFKNPNLGRVLNLHHFEVLGEYKVKTEVDKQLRLALLVENPLIGPFDRDWIRAYYHFLDEELLHDAYRNGLEAAQILAAQEWIDEQAAAEKRAFEEEQQRLAEKQVGSQSVTNYIPNKGIYATARRLKESLEVFVGLNGLEDAFNTIKIHTNPLKNVSISKLEKAEKTIARTAWWTQFNLAYPGFHEKSEIFLSALNTALDNPNNPESADDVVAAIGGLVEMLDDDWLVTLKTFGAGYLLSYITMLPALPAFATGWGALLVLNPIVYGYIMKLLFMPDDLGLPRTLSTARAEYAQHKAKQSAETLMPPAPAADVIEVADKIPPPPRAYSLTELAEAHAALDRLILHLQAHNEHYSNTFVKREDPALRMTRLTNLGIAPFVENQLLGFAGTSSIYPLRLEALPKEVRDTLKTLIPDEVIAPPSENTVTIPTGGLVSEVSLGPCDALEPYLAERRQQELHERDLRNELLEIEVTRQRESLATEENND